jgi:hypothetical protein
MAFLFRLETEDGAPAEPATLHAAVPNWRPGDTIPLGYKVLRVVDDSDVACSRCLWRQAV